MFLGHQTVTLTFIRSQAGRTSLPSSHPSAWHLHPPVILRFHCQFPWVHYGWCQLLSMSKTELICARRWFAPTLSLTWATLPLNISNSLIASSIIPLHPVSYKPRAVVFVTKMQSSSLPKSHRCFLPGLDPTHPDIMIKHHVNWA